MSPRRRPAVSLSLIHILYDDPEMSLDLYTRQCSLGVTAEQLAISAATIADDGVNPLTKKRVFGAALTSKVVARCV